MKNPDLLKETYIPPHIPAREPHITELTYCLKPATRKRKPTHAWLYGPPGTGKTLITKHILRKMNAKRGALQSQENCNISPVSISGRQVIGT